MKNIVYIADLIPHHCRSVRCEKEIKDFRRRGRSLFLCTMGTGLVDTTYWAAQPYI